MSPDPYVDILNCLNGVPRWRRETTALIGKYADRMALKVQRVPMIASLVVLCLNTLVCNAADDQDLKARLFRGDLGFTKIVAARRHAINPGHIYSPHLVGFRPGGGLCVLMLSPDGIERKQIVSSPNGMVMDCSLSFDSTEVFFSWKRNRSATYQIYRVGIDGSDLRQLTDGPCHNFNPCELPDGGVAFLSDRKSQYSYCWSSSVAVLWRMESNGANPKRLSANYVNDFTPSVLEDGRILYGRWEYVDRTNGPHQGLWSIDPDGTGLAGVYGMRSLWPVSLLHAQQIPGTQKILAVLAGHNGPLRGAIGIVDPSIGGNAEEAVEVLTPEEPRDRWLGYTTPMPLDDQHYLVTYEGSLLLRDLANTARVEIVAAEPSGLGMYSAHPVRIRERPASRPLSVAADGSPWATIVMQDVYRGLVESGKVRRGEVKRLAVIQEVEKSSQAGTELRFFGWQFPVVSCGATYAPKRVWGFADVEKDGSASFRVPAGVPLYFLPLDAEGRAVQRMRTFTHLAPGETQSCIGCHADRNYHTPISTGQATLATSKPPQELDPPSWGIRGFSYPHIVQPVLDRYCVECHDGPAAAADIDLSGDKTDFFNVSYEHLARKGTIAEIWSIGSITTTADNVGRNPYVDFIPTYNGLDHYSQDVEPKRFGSFQSLLTDLILSGHPDEAGKMRVKIDEDSRLRLLLWIDLNVPYYGTSKSNHMDRVGARRMVPEDFESVFQDVARRRCQSCHNFEGPRQRVVPFEKWPKNMQPDGQDYNRGKLVQLTSPRFMPLVHRYPQQWARLEYGVPVPRDFWLRIERPELNNFLLAPLAKSAGGTEACGRPVFSSKDDTDYRAILRTFAPLSKLLEKTPRADMVGELANGGCD